MNVKHNPKMDIDLVTKLYSEKDGVPVKYVCCTSLVENSTESWDVFYRDTPHPEFGNRYFGIRNDKLRGILITNADMVEEFKFVCVEDASGNWQYSEARWDYKAFSNGNMIDGGRAYTRRSATPAKSFRIVDGRIQWINEGEK